MILYIVRHGQTKWNVQKRLQGASDTDLNENGIALAKVTGEALKEVPFSCCFTSPLKRARDTAELVLGERILYLCIPTIGSGRFPLECGKGRILPFFPRKCWITSSTIRRNISRPRAGRSCPISWSGPETSGRTLLPGRSFRTRLY